MLSESPFEESPKGECRALDAGFCPEIPDLAVRVWSKGKVEPANGYESAVGITDVMLPVLVIFRDGQPHFGVPVAKLVASAFKGIRFDRIASVRHIDGDSANCQWDNLEPEAADDPVSDEDFAAAREAAREEGYRLAAEAELLDADDGRREDGVHVFELDLTPMPDGDYKDLLPGFFREAPDVSIRVWEGGRAKVISGHESGITISRGSLATVVSGKGFRTLILPLAKLVVAAFAGVPLEKIRSVSFRNGDFTNYSYQNLVPVFYKTK